MKKFFKKLLKLSKSPTAKILWKLVKIFILKKGCKNDEENSRKEDGTRKEEDGN